MPISILLLIRQRQQRDRLAPVEDTAFDQKVRTWIVNLFCLAVVAAMVAQKLGFIR